MQYFQVAAIIGNIKKNKEILMVLNLEAVSSDRPFKTKVGRKHSSILSS